MRILHTYCLNYNIGDYALGIGVKNLLRNYLEVDLIADANIQGQYFDEYYINEVVNKKYDLLVIGGGGIIHGAHWPNGWFWLIEKDLIKSIKIPFIVYGVGNNYFDGETIPQKAVSHLQETYSNAAFFSVRNDGSFARVKEQVGILPNVVPDPGFHVSLNTDYERKIDKPYVIVQVANDKTDQRFSSGEKFIKFISAMRNIITSLTKDYFVLLAPHVHSDIILSKQISEGIENTEIWNFGELAFDKSAEAVGYYKYAEFVLAMRGHGQIIPIGFNVPVIALSNHPKHSGLMNELGLSEFYVEIQDEDFENKVLEGIENIAQNNAELVARLHDINKELNKSSDEAFEIIKTALA